MRVGILGPLEVASGGAAVPVGGARLRALLVRLALDAGRTVTHAQLADALWEDNPPTDRVNALQSLVSRLRRALPEQSALRSVDRGYRLDLPPDAVDALLFERLAAQGHRALRAGDPDGALGSLRAALRLWRGPALADAGGARYAVGPVARLEELALAATEDRIEAELSTGRYEATVAELTELTAAHPLRERPHELLIRALHASGRQAEALAVYERVRARLADELGGDPSARLRGIHLAILRGEPVLPPGPAPVAAGAAPSPAASPAPGATPSPAPGATSGPAPGPAANPAAGSAAGSAPSPAAGTPAGTPAGRGPGTRRGNVPVALSSLVGRDLELAGLAGQVRADRLVTLVGPGGVGKTRLATALAARLAPEVPGGVWLVELSARGDPGDVPQAVADALGLRETGPLDGLVTPPDLTGRIAETLAGDDSVLIMDNCEHVVGAAARLVQELLGQCPPLRVVATSREPLGIAGEALRPVPPLGLPGPDDGPAEAAASPAVRLFAARAAAVRPDFTLGAANTAAVVEICRRLDGLPLAIELAAARLRSLPVEHLAAHLDDRFRLLTGGSRTALPRHRTLAAAVSWSWDLLEPREQRVARRLAVFPGVLTVPAASQVTGVPAAALLDILAGLVGKSLLHLVDGAEPRYRMLETIREYGRQRLAEAGETGRIRAAHAHYFRDLAAEAEPHLRGAGQVAWLTRLQAQRDSLIAALHTACDTGDAATALRLGAALGQLCAIQSNHAEAAGWLRQALAVPARAAPADLRDAVAALYILNAVLSGGRDAVGEPVPPAAADHEHPESPGGHEHPENPEGHEHPESPGGREHPAAALLRPLLALHRDDTAAGLAAAAPRSHPQAWTRAMLWLVRSLLLGNAGDLDAMGQNLASAAAEFGRAGERWGRATTLTYLGYVRTTQGRFDEAITALEEATRAQRELDPGDGAVMSRVWAAQARARAGDPRRARAELTDLLATDGAPAPSRYHFLARIALGDLARQQGEPAGARRQYRAAAADLTRVPYHADLFRAMLAAATAHLDLDTGEPEAARHRLAEALELATPSPDMPLMAIIAVAVAHLCLDGGAAATAAQVLGAGHALRGAADPFDPDVARLGRALRERLGEPGYEAAYARGRGLRRDGAVELLQAQVRRR
jgi:predicted ATPase/DNA-binding SARP family transcriptional activator